MQPVGAFRETLDIPLPYESIHADRYALIALVIPILYARPSSQLLVTAAIVWETPSI